jgi:hypothetical protein
MAKNSMSAVASPGDVLVAIVARLKEDPNTDTDLLEILRAKVLELEKDWNVDVVVKAIEELAAKRAALPPKESGDG